MAIDTTNRAAMPRLAVTTPNGPGGPVGPGFEGVMMISGGLNVSYGLIAVVDDDWVVGTNCVPLYLEIFPWGAVHLVVGLVLLFSGIGVFSDNVLARTVGGITAGVSLIARLFVAPADPLGAHSPCHEMRARPERACRRESESRWTTQNA